MSNLSKIDFIEDFLEEITEDIAKRKKELNSLKKNLDTLKSDEDKLLYARTSYPILFVHYEGFLNILKENIFIYFNNIKVNFKKLKKEIWIFPLGVKLNGISKVQKQSEKIFEVINKSYNALEVEYKEFAFLKIDFDNLNFFLNILGLNNKALNEYLIQNRVSVEKEIKENNYISDIGTLNIQLKQMYKLRNSVLHGEINKGLLSIPKKITSGQVRSILQKWEEGYYFVITLLSFLEKSIYDYLLNEKFYENEDSQTA